MSAASSSRMVRNVLLRALPDPSYGRLAPHLEPVDLAKGATVVQGGVPFDYAYFPETGLASVVSDGPSGRRVEVGVFGSEGMVSTAIVLGLESTPQSTFLQVEGRWLRTPVEVLRTAIAEDVELRSLLLRYVQFFLISAASTAVANAMYPVGARLARWLLMAHDRLEGDDLPLTHEFLSIMLGVHRPGVTVALHELEAAGMVKARRGAVTVLNRAALQRLAGAAYGAGEAEYERLIGPFSAKRARAEEPGLPAMSA